ncbi:MAG: LamG-like jellyroll fold domain-containing protein [Planctomycetota bacterium]
MTDVDFSELVSRWLDGSLTADESSALQDELDRSPARRGEFTDACDLDAGLRLLSDTAAAEPQAVVTAGDAGRRRVAPWVIATSLAAAVMLAVGYGAGLRADKEPPGGVATSNAGPTESPDGDETIVSGCAVLARGIEAVFADGVRYREGDSLPPGRLELLSGVAQIEFYSGATMLLADRAEVVLSGPWEAECLRGRVTMHVPPPAQGFRLLLPGMKVVDLGTEFGVNVAGPDVSVHVFDGEVEAHVPGSEMRLVREGESLGVDDAESTADGAAREDFLTASGFETRLASYYEGRQQDWWDGMKEVRADPRIVGCYLFREWPDDRWKRLINNFAIPRVPRRAGSAVGSRWVEGRWPTKTAMEFKSAGDRVRMNLGEEQYDGLTMAAWIRVDGLDRKYNALLLTDGYDDGEPHWQIDEQGRLMFSVIYTEETAAENANKKRRRRNQIYYSPPLFPSADRRWRHVAVTYDTDTGETVQYFDGREVGREVSEHHRPDRRVTFGPCEIGNWGISSEGHAFPVRNFNGRIDEFISYSEPLSGAEIAGLYERGAAN